jgi:hypothetical protein
MSVCYFKTSSSSADTPEVLLADNSSEATSSKTMGILKDTIAPGERGKLILVGEYDKFDTSAYNVGDRLWLGTFGGIVTTPPTAPEHAVFLGVVSRSQGVNGRICVSIQNGYELEELHNVTSDDYTTPQDEDSVLTFDSTQELWKRLTLFNLYTYVKNYFDSLYQAILVSGTNIKTLNGSSILGSGDLVVGGGGGGINTQIPLGSGDIYSNIPLGNSSANMNIGANNLYLMPFIPNVSFTTLNIFINVAVVGTGNSRLLLYSHSNITGLPDTKLFESVDITNLTLGIKTITTTLTFTAGTVYWFGIYSSSSVQFLGSGTAGLLQIGVDSSNTQYQNIQRSGVAFGTAPSTFGTSHAKTQLAFVRIGLTAS